MGKYTCTECGNEEDALYRDFNAGIIKICHCRHCSKVVDKYIETDSIIILLDLILHKLQAYRHILFNCKINFHLKFTLVLLLFETYNKWVMLHRTQESEGELVIVYAALEISFYKMSLITIFELLCFLSALSILLTLKEGKNLRISALLLQPHVINRRYWDMLQHAVPCNSFHQRSSCVALLNVSVTTNSVFSLLYEKIESLNKKQITTIRSVVGHRRNVMNLIKRVQMKKYMKAFNEFRANAGQKTIIVHFTTDWSGPCRNIKPHFNNYASRYTSLAFVNVDVSNMPDVSRRYGVTAYPTFMILKKDEKIGVSYTGDNEEELMELITTFLASKGKRNEVSV